MYFRLYKYGKQVFYFSSFAFKQDFKPDTINYLKGEKMEQNNQSSNGQCPVMHGGVNLI